MEILSVTKGNSCESNVPCKCGKIFSHITKHIAFITHKKRWYLNRSLPGLKYWFIWLVWKTIFRRAFLSVRTLRWFIVSKDSQRYSYSQQYILLKTAIWSKSFTRQIAYWSSQVLLKSVLVDPVIILGGDAVILDILFTWANNCYII